MACDFHHRYANYEEENPRKRKYQGNQFIKDVELFTISLAKWVFNADFVELRAISGQIADLAVINALTSKGDLIMELGEICGGHAAATRLAKSGLVSLRVRNLPFNSKEMNIDADAARKLIEGQKPKLIILGASNFLFPHPVTEIAEVANNVGAFLTYDASHVFGLIAGKRFQMPFKEGAIVVMGSTHKTLPGPQGGLIMAKEVNKALPTKLKNGIHPTFVTNHHPHRIAGLAIALLEMMAFGKEYAQQIVENAKALGQALYTRGFNVLCPHKDFTESHTILVDVSELGYGDRVAKALERSNIIVNKTWLPSDTSRSRFSGIRLGTQEITRLGMSKSEMDDIGELFERALLKGESPDVIAQDVIELRKEFRNLHFCFDHEKDAYEYFDLSEAFSEE
jgi:glycine hydroxymethyltransferase